MKIHENLKNNKTIEYLMLTLLLFYTVIVYSTSFTLGDAIFHFPNNGCFIQQKKKRKKRTQKSDDKLYSKYFFFFSLLFRNKNMNNLWYIK